MRFAGLLVVPSAGGGSGGGGGAGVGTIVQSGPYRFDPLTDAAIENLPWYFQRDATIRGLFAAAARELERIRLVAEAVRSGWFPQVADDDLGLLAIWEDAFRLPVNPAGVSVADRRAAVVAQWRKRSAARGSDWVAAITALLGSGWSYREDSASYTVAITVPFAGSSYSAGQIASLARALTPAHLALTTGYDEGFIVGVSQVGVDAL